MMDGTFHHIIHHSESPILCSLMKTCSDVFWVTAHSYSPALLVSAVKHRKFSKSSLIWLISILISQPCQMQAFAAALHSGPQRTSHLPFSPGISQSLRELLLYILETPTISICFQVQPLCLFPSFCSLYYGLQNPPMDKAEVNVKISVQLLFLKN